MLEPYDPKPFIRSVRPLPFHSDADPDTVAAVAVDLTDGRTDVLIACQQATRVTLEGGIEMQGLFGLVRRRDDTVTTFSASSAGPCLRAGDAEPAKSAGMLDRHRGPGGHHRSGRQWRGTGAATTPNAALYRPADSLPQHISSRHNVSDPRATSPADASDTGDLTLVAGFKDARNFAAGVTLFVESGRPVRGAQLGRVGPIVRAVGRAQPSGSVWRSPAPGRSGHDAGSFNRCKTASQIRARPSCLAKSATYSRSTMSPLIRKIPVISRKCFSEPPSR